MSAKPNYQQIADAFDEAEDDFGDKSTSFLVHIVIDRLGVTYSDVIDALAWQAGRAVLEQEGSA